MQKGLVRPDRNLIIIRNDIKTYIKEFNGITIPMICKRFQNISEFEIMSIIGDLESIGDIHLSGFHTAYDKDGSAIYIAKYSG